MAGKNKTVVDRDGMISAGVEYGVVDAHNRLDEMFEENLIQ